MKKPHKQKGCSIPTTHLDEVAKANGTARNRNGQLKGLQQFETPMPFAEECQAKLSEYYPKFPLRSAYDPQCATGNLLIATGYGTPKFGVDLDPDFGGDSIYRATGASAKFDEVVNSVIAPSVGVDHWHADVAVANPPFGFRWGGVDSSKWTLDHCMAHANAGYMVSNADTIKAKEWDKHPWVVGYLERENLWPNVDVVAGVIFWVRPEADRRDPTIPTTLATIFRQANAVLVEEVGRAHDWNFWLDHVGRIRSYLSTRVKIERNITAKEIKDLVALESNTPMSLAGDFKARKTLKSLLDCGFYKIEPECKAEILRAVEDAHAAEIPIMPVTDFELVAYAESDGSLRCNYPASGFTTGRRYVVDSVVYKFKEKFTRKKIHLNEKSLKTYTDDHNCELTGCERKLIVIDDMNRKHEFVDRPDPETVKVNIQHKESDLWGIFEKPIVNTVVEACPDILKRNQSILTGLEMLGDFTYIPGQKPYLSRVGCKDHALIAAETGVGKSLCAISLAQLKGARRPLIVAPQGTVKESVDKQTGERSAAQWIEEINRFAPWAEVYPFYSPEQYESYRLPCGNMPDGFYISYYECLFRNGAKEFAPRSWTNKNLYPLMGKVYQPKMMPYRNPLTDVMEIRDVNGGADEDWIDGMGDTGRNHEAPQSSHIKCVAKPCLAELIGDDFDMLLADEGHKACFPYSTLVITDKGQLMIGDIVEKQLDVKVLSCNLHTQVTEWEPILDHIQIDTRNPLVKVTHESGSFICTSDHEIYTDKGKIPAARLKLGANLRTLPREVHGSEARQEHRKVLFEGVLDPIERAKDVVHKAVRSVRSRVLNSKARRSNRSVLLAAMRQSKACRPSRGSNMPELRCQVSNDSKEEPDLVQPVVPQGAGKSNSRSRGHSEDEKFTKGKNLPVTGRQRAFNEASVDTSNRAGMGDGDSNSDSQCERSIPITTVVLQGGSRPDLQEDSDRDRWKITPDKEAAVFRPEEDRSIECSRVVSVEVLERGDTERLTEGHGDHRRVYCLEVGNNHNFFADGVLVSNCNIQAQLTDALIRIQPRWRYVLTATPIPNIVSNLFSLFGWLCVSDWYRGGVCNAAWPYRREDHARFEENFLSVERDRTQEIINKNMGLKGGKVKSISPIISSPARLLKILKPTMAYISKPDCNPDYKRPEIIDVRVSMGKQQAKLYAHYMDRANVPEPRPMQRAALQMTILRGLCAEPQRSEYNRIESAPVRSSYNPKMHTILTLCRDFFGEGRQVVIVNSRIDLTDCIEQRLAEAGVECSRIDGTTKANQHAAQAKAFKRGDTRVLLMGIKCAQAYSFDNCDRLIIGSLEYSYGSFEQAKGRVDRILSKGVQIYCVLNKDTIEETVFDAVVTKQDNAIICLQGKRVPRDFKPIDEGELLAQSFDKFSSAAVRRDLTDEAESAKQWPSLRSEISEAYKGIGTTALIA